MCSKQSATSGLIGKCQTFLKPEVFLLEASGKAGRAHFLSGAAALCCVESPVSWLQGVLISPNCAAFSSAFVYPSRTCPSVCLSHTAVLLRDMEKVHVASGFSPKSFCLSGWSHQAPLAWECPTDHGMSLQERHLHFAERVTREQRLFEAETATVHSCMKCFVYFKACS